MQTIRQQTAFRSALVRTAERRLPRKSVPPRPMGFLIDGTACTDDTLIYPRTTRQAFGHYAADPAPNRVTFLQRPRAGWLGLLATVAVLAFFVISGVSK